MTALPEALVERCTRVAWERRRTTNNGCLPIEYQLEPWGDGTIPRSNDVDGETRAVLAEAHVADLIEALREIADPIKYMKQRAAAEDARIDGMMANQLSNDPHFIKAIAIRVLARIDGAAP